MDLRFPSQVIFGGNSQLIHEVDFLQFRNLLYWVPDNILFTYPDSKPVILAKLGINVLLAAKFSTLNNIASISAQVKANTHRIMDIMNRDQRLGPTYLKPRIGFGGPSLLRDTHYLSQVAHDNGLPEEKQLYVKILANNRTTRRRFVKMVLAKLIGMKNKTIAIFGFASKHNTSDLTNSPAWKVCKMLLKHRVHLRIHDPEFRRTRILRCLRRRVGQGRVVVTTSPVQAATNASAICILTDSDTYQNANYVQLYTQLFAVMRHPSYIFDGRNLGIDWQPVTALGFSIHAVGKPSIDLGF
ncbi:Udp-glucose 6-dehydrogenase [Thalictrum thalictroides]|uniref:UDP-glucose 6-dehydrogenase n=1 Tax=Thalictrum thalictroides TaxID=46969 RepID=A0A7J6VFP7_THATH|nr:Udp-glucose 6-dehydrogenase [Thalictrum thalictroides]